MKEILLIKNGELALKGLNRSTFEDMLIKNLRRKLSGILECDIEAITARAEALGMQVVETRLRNGWAMVRVQK